MREEAAAEVERHAVHVADRAHPAGLGGLRGAPGGSGGLQQHQAAAEGRGGVREGRGGAGRGRALLEGGWQSERDKRRGVGGGSAVMVYFVLFIFFFFL